MSELLNKSTPVVATKPGTPAAPAETCPFETGVRIISSQGIFHVSLRMDHFLNFSNALIPFAIWLDGLDESHRIILSIVTPRQTNVSSPQAYLTLMNALSRCKAHISIKMDHYEPTQASYLYLVADTVIVYPSGGLFFGPVHEVLQNDTLEIKPVFVSYIKSLAEAALQKGFLSEREFEAIANSISIGLCYKDIVSRDLSAVGPGLDIRE